MTRTPGRRRSIHHVDGGDFALRLQKRSADLRKVERRRLGDFAGGSNGISVVGAASGQDRALDHRDVALTELPHIRLPPDSCLAANLGFAFMR